MEAVSGQGSEKESGGLRDLMVSWTTGEAELERALALESTGTGGWTTGI